MYQLIPLKVRDAVKSSALGPLVLLPYRLQTALRHSMPRVFRAWSWSFTCREHYNFTYHLEPLNVRYLISFVAVITGQHYATIEKYVREIQQDEQLKSHIQRITAQSAERHVADREVRYGRRLGWYAIIRATKPRIAVETGIDKGFGSCVIAAALMRNAQEGSPGKMYGLDLNPHAGYLLQEPYSKFGAIVFGDSHQTIPTLPDGVDFFIHDSDHAVEHETIEFNLIKPKLSSRAFLLSDNSEVTDVLLNFANANQMDFLFFAESPEKHWITPAGIGAAFKRQSKPGAA